MNRLTKRLNGGKELCIDVCGEQCVDGYTWCPKCKPFSDVMKKLADYEDLEEQEMLIRLPCKVGSTVWKISRFLTGSECGDLPDVWYRIDQDNFTLSMLGYYGKTIFLTKEEAEQALAKMKEV